MIPARDSSWQQLLKDAITEPDELLQQLGLEHLTGQIDPTPEFAMRVPEPFWRRMQPGQADDPLLRQVLPLGAERTLTPGYSQDPLAESAATATAGLVHKYAGRALVVATGACAINCRYCFRRHFPYGDHGPKTFAGVLEHLQGDPSVTEVILSGGDPLVLGDQKLGDLLSALADIPHVQRLRIHTRLPVVLPERVTTTLCNTLANLSTKLPIVVVVHTNHANELDAGTATAMQLLQTTGITLLNQSVLLAGVNDNATSLVNLSEKLFSQSILPYYLHLPDPIQGTAHFNVNLEQARSIFRDICGLLPGYLVPRLVREVAGGTGKELIND